MRLFLAALSLALAAAAPATAVTYDAFSSFTGTNTGGAFTYGSLDTTGAAPVFTAYNDTPGCAALISNTICTSNGSLPAAFKSTSGAHQSGSVIVPGDALLLHPGPNAGQSSAVLFTAPTTSNYTVSFTGFVADNNPSGVNLQFFLLGPQGGYYTFATLGAANLSYSMTADLGVVLPAGGQFGFAVNYDGVYYDDSTGINVTVTPIPEPASWALMIAGFGLVGVAARRRGRAVAA
jgi:hypothetical protein